jgi:hypothetical protein
MGLWYAVSNVQAGANVGLTISLVALGALVEESSDESTIDRTGVPLLLGDPHGDSTSTGNSDINMTGVPSLIRDSDSDTSNDVLMEIEAFEPPPISGLSKLDVSYSLSTGNREKGIYTAFNYI